MRTLMRRRLRYVTTLASMPCPCRSNFLTGAYSRLLFANRPFPLPQSPHQSLDCHVVALSAEEHSFHLLRTTHLAHRGLVLAITSATLAAPTPALDTRALVSPQEALVGRHGRAQSANLRDTNSTRRQTRSFPTSSTFRFQTPRDDGEGEQSRRTERVGVVRARVVTGGWGVEGE